MSELISCPECGFSFSLDQAMSKKLEAGLEKELAKKLAFEKAKIEKAAEINLASIQEALDKAKANELQLRRQKTELEQKAKDIDLEVQRKLDEEKSVLESRVAERLAEAHRLKDSEKDRKLADALAQAEEMKRKIEQGSQQAQGETLEVELEQLLNSEFPLDSIEPVAKGVKGGDMVQTVKIRSGQECGSIIWEVKRTKAWSDAWIAKVKADARASKCDICLIATETLPKNIKSFGEIEGVWISSPENCIQLAHVLRQTLIQVAREKYLQSGKKDKAVLVYDYLIGQEFKGKVESILESYKNMKSDLEAERRASEKLFAKREKQISQVILAVAGFHGELEALTGPELPKVELLEADQ